MALEHFGTTQRQERISRGNILEVEPVSDEERSHFISVLEQFAEENQAFREAKVGYYRYLLQVVERADKLLRTDESVEAIRTFHEGKKMQTLIIPAGKQTDFLDIFDNKVVGQMSINYEWEPDSPSVYGTCTTPGEEFESRGFNSHRIRTVASYLYEVKKQLLHSAKRFDDKRSKLTWDGLVKEGRAKWIDNQARYEYVPETSV